MNDRLEKIRYDKGLEWGELANLLGISRSMLGFIRNGRRKPSAALLLRIRQLESPSCSNDVAIIATNSDELVAWKNRALAAEAKLTQLRKAIKNFIKITQNLEGAL